MKTEVATRNPTFASWNPFEELRFMQRRLDRMMDWPRVAREDIELGSFENTLPVDIFDKDNKLVVKAGLPGVKPEDIHVNVTDGVLHISAEMQQDNEVNEEDYHRREYRYGKWSRSFRLPPNVNANKIDAKYDNGMLLLTIPRVHEATTKSIEVKVK